jgi:Zn-dependent peptidase ImmA (M78 family)
MAAVEVSSARFRSLLENRNRTVDDIATSVTTTCDLLELAQADLMVELDDVEAIAKFFARPWPYLLIDEPESRLSIGRDHRRHPGDVSELSQELLEALRASEEQLLRIVELFPGELMQSVDQDLSGGSAEEAGSHLRRFLDVAAREQLAPHDEYQALRTWIEAVDRRGIYVAQRRFKDDSVRAFSLFQNGHALTVLDTGDTGWARCFSLLHELVHLQMRSAGICDLDENSAVERWCNAVAAACLMPPDLLADADVAGLRQAPDIADQALRASAKHLGVSQLALLIRCRDLGLLQDEEYDGLLRRWAQRRGSGERVPGGDFYINVLNRMGRRYARHVFTAVGDEVLTRQEAAVALDVRESQLDRLRRQL